MKRAVACTAAALLLALGGCSSTNLAISGKSEVAAQDPFALYNSTAMSQIGFAQARVRSECMVAAGYGFAAAWAPTKESWTSGEELRYGYEGPLLRTTEQARAAGFGDGIAAEPEVLRDAANEAAAIDDYIGESCLEMIFQKAGETARKDYDDYAYAGASMSGELNLQLDALGIEPLDRVVKCLADAGYPVKRSTKSAYGFETTMTFGKLSRKPTERQETVRNGKRYAAATTPNPYVPTKEESELAGAYSECAVSTGARESYVKAIRSLQGQIADKYEPQLLELAPRITELAKKVEAISGAN